MRVEDKVWFNIQNSLFYWVENKKVHCCQEIPSDFIVSIFSYEEFISELKSPESIFILVNP